MTLGQILFELRTTQKRMDGQKDGWMDGHGKGKLTNTENNKFHIVIRRFL
jgi:hypothetical protein